MSSVITKAEATHNSLIMKLEIWIRKTATKSTEILIDIPKLKSSAESKNVLQEPNKNFIDFKREMWPSIKYELKWEKWTEIKVIVIKRNSEWQVIS